MVKIQLHFHDIYQSYARKTRYSLMEELFSLFHLLDDDGPALAWSSNSVTFRPHFTTATAHIKPQT